MSDYFSMPMGMTNFEEPEGPEGPLIVHNVPIMASGIWPSMNGKSYAFSKQFLLANLDNWSDSIVWNRHPLIPGENRSATDSIGAVLKRYFEPNFTTKLKDGTTYQGAAIMGDVLFHRKTDESRDAATLIRLPYDQGGFRMVSAEMHMDGVEFDAERNVYTPESCKFFGLTIQREGGCAACNIPAFAKAAPGQETGNMAEPEKPATPAPPTPGGAEQMPEWARVMSEKMDKILAIASGQGGGAPPAPANAAPAATMSAPAPDVEAFAASELKVKDLEEKLRVANAIIEKAKSKPAIENFAEPGPKLSTNIESTSMHLIGKSLHLRRVL
jgi:hypothetical protein